LHPGALKQKDRALRAQAEGALTLLTRSHPRATPPRGQKKLRELARTLMADPTVVLPDQPATGANARSVAKVCAKADEPNRDLGITAAVVEHDVRLVLERCDPVVLIRGTKFAEGPATPLRSDPRVHNAHRGVSDGAACGSRPHRRLPRDGGPAQPQSAGGGELHRLNHRLNHRPKPRWHVDRDESGLPAADAEGGLGPGSGE
jgi:energy-coupling factor transporter ATP-binding protein EcfA2